LVVGDIWLLLFLLLLYQHDCLPARLLWLWLRLCQLARRLPPVSGGDGAVCGGVDGQAWGQGESSVHPSCVHSVTCVAQCE
jgi:hypothetical protein